MNRSDYPPRLPVLAAILDDDYVIADEDLACDVLAREARLGSDIFGKAESATEAEPTPLERALAEALHDGVRNDGASADHAIAELLLLADDIPAASDLATGLSQAFLLPDDSGSPAAHEERCSPFAELYRNLALHQLNNQVRNKASAILCQLSRGRQDAPSRQIATG